MEYNWPLSIPQFTWKDKIKFAKFILTNDRWTQSNVVAEFEKEMASFVGTKYAVFTSSGSTANTLLAMYLRDSNRYPSKKYVVVFPSTTWITSVSPFLREGFNPEFIDINLSDFSMDLDKLEDYLKVFAPEVACVFITSLIGYVPDIERIDYLSKKYIVKIMMDNCENTLGLYKLNNISSYFTSTTSTYFGHQIQSVEGGFVFTNDLSEYDYFLMARNHGMTRHLPPERQKIYANPSVDSKFDFHMLGNNFRNTNINAFLGLLDLKRADEYLFARNQRYLQFFKGLSHYLILPFSHTQTIVHAPFCLPIILKPGYTNKLLELKKLCEDLKIETRPIISGNLLRQTCLNEYQHSLFANSEYLHQNGFYVGLHSSTTSKEVQNLIIKIRQILCR